jgi:glyoxylate/hydroxypyruvate reductase A
MTTIALINQTAPLSFLVPALERAMSNARLIHWPEPGWEAAEVALCWRPPPGVLASMTKLRLIHSIGAGVDGIMADPLLPNLPICRVSDDTLALAMAEYVLWGALHFHRQMDVVIDNARRARWHRLEQSAARDCRVGLMGVGTLGLEAARLLKAVGYRVSGWVRSPREVAGVKIFAGQRDLPAFLGETDILVCLLPLTHETRGILNREQLSKLPKGSALILCSRGEHLVVDDLVALLREQHLRGAILDVFEHEPLPMEHPLWREPGVLVTPHMAGLAKPAAIAKQIGENIRRLDSGATLLNRVNGNLGY